MKYQGLKIFIAKKNSVTRLSWSLSLLDYPIRSYIWLEYAPINCAWCSSQNEWFSRTTSSIHFLHRCQSHLNRYTRRIGLHNDSLEMAARERDRKVYFIHWRMRCHWRQRRDRKWCCSVSIRSEIKSVSCLSKTITGQKGSKDDGSSVTGQNTKITLNLFTQNKFVHESSFTSHA